MSGVNAHGYEESGGVATTMDLNADIGVLAQVEEAQSDKGITFAKSKHWHTGVTIEDLLQFGAQVLFVVLCPSKSI